MKKTGIWSSTAVGLCLLLLILDGKAAVAGAQSGIQLCLVTVIPALLPFFLLSNLLLSQLLGREQKLLSGLGRLCGFPTGGSALMIPAFLGGYPMGAQAVGNAYSHGQITKSSASSLLLFCNNAGPAFLLGMVAPMFPEPWMGWSLWAIHVGCAVFIGSLMQDSDEQIQLTKNGTCSSSEAMGSALSAMASVCGWVICFRALLSFCGKWFLWRLPLWTQVLVTGLTELVNGCSLLPMVSSVAMRYILAAGLLGAGGLCVAMQTASVLKGLPMRRFLLGKLLHMVLSMWFASAVLQGYWPALLTAGVAFSVIRRKTQSNSGIFVADGV